MRPPSFLVLGIASLLLGAAPSDPPPAAGPDAQLVARARTARDCARSRGLLSKPSSRLAIVDFSLPSTQKRLWVLDEHTGAVVFHELVAHGKNTGDDRATVFSDEPGSLRSSLGLFVAAEPYVGSHGASLRLDGLEPGINGNARERAIVMHGAEYVSEDFVAEHGRLGRSWGCPAVRTEVIEPLIKTIAEGTPLFAWHSDSQWEASSALSSCSSP